METDHANIPHSDFFSSLLHLLLLPTLTIYHTHNLPDSVSRSLGTFTCQLN